MSKQVQIDWELFVDLYAYFCDNENAPKDYATLEIKEKIEEKVDKIINRELFSKYKRMPTGAEREKARQEYLDHRGIHRDWRTDEEYHFPDPPSE